MPLFHISNHQFAIGDLVQRGRWGNALRTYQFDAGLPDGAFKGWRLASELLLEQVRREIASHLPSRWDCTFAFADHGQAVARMSLWASIPKLYEVEMVVPDAATHVADWHLLSGSIRFNPAAPFMALNEQLAKEYWVPVAALQMPEMLCASDLRVTAIL
ncbi:hypothetical protein [Burkholderia territorii]|uniref:hypothetical protein n=1 Tax=Burkholderia territorii TaxID=1503055 RepID=UPI000757FDCA|nr:hypothetical protein [Burkholderia territorii]KWA04628.1 hypothetical protein WT36_19075 [Burkholderia territorii]KWA35741.1 hypothetical protein WT41_01430 [Burkholderia territorii]